MNYRSIAFRIVRILLILLLAVTASLAIIGTSLFEYLSSEFNVDLVQIVYTLRAPLDGANTDIVNQILSYCKLSIIQVLAIIIVVICADYYLFVRKKDESFRGLDIIRKAFCAFLVAVISIESFNTYLLYTTADVELGISEYVKLLNERTDIYDKYYVTPDIDKITSDKKRNLLYIYLESMETTYASKDVGGEQVDVNYIPNLTKLANDNISFSNSDKLGGFHSTIYTTWTMGALFATQSGVPLSFPVQQNYRFKDRSMASGLITLGDILKEKGYYQEFLCGSLGEYGGRQTFFTQHGDFDVYDVYTAIDNGYVAEDELVWWGVEDKNLYKIAKDELTRMSKLDQPFHLSMLTVDTHFVGGWICSLCDEKYDSIAANAISCGDRQIYDFLKWCREQPWYENTTIIVQGDHPRMDNELVEEVDDYDRVVYNCFINPCIEGDISHINCKNRVFTSLDMFPTVLAAMGYSFPEDRLGLGTNLFSDKKTLSEELGYDYVNTETGKYSVYYIDHFS